MADCPSFLSATHRLANFQFESSDALVNRPRDEQNCKHRRDSATGYGEDHKVMVCKKHGVPSGARYGGKGRHGALSDSAGVLIPKCDGRSSEPAATWAFLPGSSNRLKARPGSSSLGSLLERIRGFFVPFPTYAPQRTRRGGMYVLCLMTMNVMNLVHC